MGAGNNKILGLVLRYFFFNLKVLVLKIPPLVHSMFGQLKKYFQNSICGHLLIVLKIPHLVLENIFKIPHLVFEDILKLHIWSFQKCSSNSNFGTMENIFKVPRKFL